MKNFRYMKTQTSTRSMMRRYLKPICLFAISCVAVAASTSAQADKRIVQAEQYFAKGEYYTAATLYEQYLAPSSQQIVQANFPLNSKKRRTETGSGAGKGVGKNDILFRKAESYRLANYMNEAIASFKEVGEKEPIKYNHAWYWKAVCERALGKYADAEESISKYQSNAMGNDPYKNAAEKELATIRFIRSQVGRPDSVMFTLKQVPLQGTDKGSFAPAQLNGNRFVVTSTATDTAAAVGANPNRNRLFYTTYNNGSFDYSEEVQIEGANAQMQQGAATVTADGNHLFFTQWIKENNKTTAAVYHAAKTTNGWGNVQAVTTINKEGFSSKQPSVTADGKYLFFASNMQGGNGGFDIWYAPLNADGTTGTPVNAGAAVNTEADEQSPFYHNSSSTLVFSSNGHLGMGGFDLFTSKGAVGSWNAVENAGHPVNSSRDDVYFFAAEGAPLLTKAIFSSDRGSDCCLQNYTVTKAPKKEKLSGVIRDLTDNNPVPDSEVTLKDATGKTWKQTTNAEGRYTFDLTGSGPYSLTITKKHYKEKITSSQIETKDDKDWAIDILKNKDEFIEKRVILRPETIVTVYFDFDKHNIKTDAGITLDSVYNVLTQFPGATLQISGYTDMKGTEEYNKVLADKRARACKQYLVSKGIDSNRISIESFGECCPLELEMIDGKDNPAGRAKNRRGLINVVMPKEEE
ncbi:MAG: OmpA family protein [Chitinophagaceae bacterium]|nr:OmpA family protein [Chitinophagaceae bacterium]